MSKSKKPSPPLRVNPQPTPKIGKSERTRAAILNAGLEFVWSHPYRDMTVNTLMTSAGLSRSAFYKYFNDLHGLMETLLNMLKEEVFAATGSWFTGVGDPVVLLNESLAGLVDVCYRLGPILRATDDASANDETLEKAWMLFVSEFDDAITSRIEADQAQDLITNFDARPIAIALNRLNIYTLIQDFGQQPRSKPETVHKALARVWISTLYRAEWLEKGSSNISRT